MPTTPIDAKKTMLLHSEAKVDFFKKYLQRYLRILYLAPTIQEINIFDVFCGTGIYDNGKKGSPIVSFESIVDLRSQFGFDKQVNLIVNDGKPEKIDVVKRHIDSLNQHHCSVNYHTLSAEEMFAHIGRTLASQSSSSRNLVFIDPYGYKEIKRQTLEQILSNNRTEIILFLPISQMQRFTKTALESELRPYEPLKEFVHGFFPIDHPIREETVPAKEYISYVKDALRFGRYYSTSYYIERDASNVYALFFISPHIYGFEQILDVKWELDEEDGRGFRLPEAPTLFDNEVKELKRGDNFVELERQMTSFLAQPRTNQEVYRFVLSIEFRPKHVSQLFKKWEDTLPAFKIMDPQTKQPLRKGYYIAWKYCNPAKPTGPKAIFSLDGNMK